VNGPGTADGTERPSRSTEVAEAVLDGEAVLYHERYQTVCVLNPTATLIWSQLDGEVTVDDLAADLVAAFAVDGDTILADVVVTLRDLGRHGLLEGVDPDPVLLEGLLLAPLETHGTPRA
jgi:hypothetical protein